MEHRYRLHLLTVLLLFAAGADARVFMTQKQALAAAFPAGSTVSRQAVFLTPAETSAAQAASGVEFRDQMIVRYVASAGGRVVGYAYFDTHRVRTLAETVMVVVTPDARVGKIEILSFDEPPDYLPGDRWIAQFSRRPLDDELSLKRAIRPLAGATLSGRAILNASRKVLALHKVIGAR